MPLFFFSSRRRHTRSYGDWSSDVCSSDLMLVTSEIVRSQADVEQGRLVTSIATVQYLAWAIPAIGFLGTVRGLAGGMSMAVSSEESTQHFLDQATRHLAIAFDCTFVALALSLVVMYFLHAIQRQEEALVLDCHQFCHEHLVM